MNYVPVTTDWSDATYNPDTHRSGRCDANIWGLSWIRYGIDSAMQIPQMRDAWSKVFRLGTLVSVGAYGWEFDGDLGGIMFEVTEDHLRFRIQRQGVSQTGERTIHSLFRSNRVWVTNYKLRPLADIKTQ